MKIKVQAPAKINLFLDIVGKLENGYHSLFMVMQTVSVFDTVSLDTDSSEISVTCSREGIPTDRKNIAYKAAELFFEKTGKPAGVKIHIDKNIPAQAGLAGGSADGAAVLVGLNHAFGNPLSDSELRSLGLKCGSDVPFSILGGTCLAQNTGEVLSELPPLKDCYIVLAKPQYDVSTALAYEEADKARIYHPDCIGMLNCCANGDFEGICSKAENVFEQVIEVPDRVTLKKIFRNNNCSLCQMSGSGPTVFGIFENKSDAECACKAASSICKEVFIAGPTSAGAQIVT